MDQIVEIQETGLYETITPTKKQTVGDLVEELGLTGKLIGVLVNNKKVDLDFEVNEKDTIVILPNIAGGK